MTRKRSSLSSTRSGVYSIARLLGDVNAVSRGPGAVGRRVIRKAAGRTWGRLLSRLL